VLTLFIKLTESSTVSLGQIENIDGITFPATDSGTLITEKLAHLDVYLNHSPLARELTVNITLIPINTTGIAVGIRENSFWLSYSKHKICCQQDQSQSNKSKINASVTIPITDKIIDTNKSLDLMFFSSNPSSTNLEDEGVNDETMWILEHLQISSSPTMPSYNELKDFIKSRLTLERPL
jgi:hypothetical protein